MPFDAKKLKTFCLGEIHRFAKDHQDEVFYAFAVDAALLCLNSEREHKKTVKQYRERWDYRHRLIKCWEDLSEWDLRDARLILEFAEQGGLVRSDKRACLAVINEDRARKREEGNPYCTRAGMKRLRWNTGDWAYQGFATMTGIVGFDERAYERHYDMDDDKQTVSAYGKAMNKLVEDLRSAGAFRRLRTTPTFRAMRVEHGY